MSYQKEWLLLEANDEVDEMEHRDPSEEYQFYRAVADGDVNAVRHNCELGRFREGEGVGQLSRDPVLNLKYHFVITTAMVTRLCGQHGMELEQAFRLSDFYIQKLDDLHTADEVCALHDEMVMDFTKKMRKNLRSDTNSKHINEGKDYIYAHIKERITIEDLADELGVSPSYLSRLFKKETGMSVSAYIRQQKIEIAKKPAALQRQFPHRHCQPAGLFLSEPFHPAVPRSHRHDPQEVPGRKPPEPLGRLKTA